MLICSRASHVLMRIHRPSLILSRATSAFLLNVMEAHLLFFPSVPASISAMTTTSAHTSSTFFSSTSCVLTATTSTPASSSSSTSCVVTTTTSTSASSSSTSYVVMVMTSTTTSSASTYGVDFHHHNLSAGLVQDGEARPRAHDDLRSMAAVAARVLLLYSDGAGPPLRRR
jgi:hypothetical protein